MKRLLLALSLVVATAGMLATPIDAQAKRLGAGRPAGMQRQAPAKPADATPHTTPNAAPQNAAAPQPAAPQPAAPPVQTPGKRSWMGPLAGLAAGLGIAALASHFGFGEGLANIMSLLLVGVLAMVALRFVLARFGGNRNAGPVAQPAGMPAGWNMPSPAQPPASQPVQLPAAAPAERSALAAPAGAMATATAQPASGPTLVLPEGVSPEDFLRLAKMVFIRLQAANDAGNIDDLRKFTTPELFAALRLDIQERGNAAQQTDVVKLDAQVVDVARENGHDVVSVRFHGLIREAADAGAEPFDELWHLVRPVDALGKATGDWAIAGITPQTVPQT